MYSLEEAKEMVRRIVKEFVQEIWQYLREECDNIVVRRVHFMV